MSVDSGLNRIKSILGISNIFSQIDLYLTGFFIIIGLSILSLSYIKGLGQYGLGFAFLCSALVYILYLKKLNADNSPLLSPRLNIVNSSNSYLLLLNIIFFMLYTASLFILFETINFRSSLYFIVVSFAVFVLIIEILIIPQKGIIPLFLFGKTILLCSSIKAGRFFLLPVIPGTDIQDHMSYVNIIIDSGHLPGYDIADKYAFTPLWHIYESICQFFLSPAPQKEILFLSVSISLLVILSIFVYLIVKTCFNEKKIALLSVILLNVADMVQVLSLSNINPGILVLIFLSILVYLIIRKNNGQSGLPILLIYMFIVLSVLTHQLTTFILYISLIVIFSFVLFFNSKYNFLSNMQLPKEQGLNITVILFFTVILIFYWQMISPSTQDSSFFSGSVERLGKSIESMIGDYLFNKDIITTSYEKLFSENDTLTNVLFSLGSNILLFFGLVGALISLNLRYFSKIRGALLSVVIVLFILIYPGTYIGLNQVLIPHRFLPFFEFFIVPFAATAIYYLFILTKKQRIIFWISLFMLIFFLITTPYLSNNDTLYCKDITSRGELLFSEVSSIEWSQQHSPEGTVIVDDLIYPSQLSFVEGFNFSITNIISYRNYGQSHLGQGIIIIREDIIKTGLIQQSGSFGNVKTLDYRPLLAPITQKTNKVFMSNDIVGYVI